MSEEGEPSRWTCEACGCHTNVETDRSCGICGTSRTGSSLLRRRVPWLPHRAIVGMPPDADDDDVEDFIHHLQHPPNPHGDLFDMDDAESAIESLAMEVASSRGRMIESRERFLEAARHFGQRRQARQESAIGSLRTRAEMAAAATTTTSQQPRLSAPEMRTMASVDYQPQWLRRGQAYATRGGKGTAPSNALEIGQGDRQNLAHVPFGAGEGRAIRAEAPFPRHDIVFTFGEPPAADTESSEPPKRNIFGFRVAFDRPNMEVGASMGGGYKVGVTSSSFISYSEHNALQHTQFFWGIEDSGKKFEGSRRGQWTLADRVFPPPRRAAGSSNPMQQQPEASSSYATQLGPQDVSLNRRGVLFGNREVVTVVCDLDNRVMAFWRGTTLLGIQITTLPRAGDLFPVAVPYHHGSTVVVTALDVDPLPLLTSFAADRRQAQREKNEELHRKLLAEREIIIQDSKLTKALRSTLVDIFAYYSKHDVSDDPEGAVLDFTEAARLWYRCGLKLDLLKDGERVSFTEFLGIFEQICAEDDAKVVTVLPDRVDIKVGDYVELVEGYDKFGDASSGPLEPFARGLVVDLQNGTDGERQSIRVLHNLRRWWYQPSAIMPETSGLIATPAVFFIRRVLRAHGYDHLTLTPLYVKTLRSTMCQLGDIVKPRKPIDDVSFGRVSVETTVTNDSAAPRSRPDNATVVVQFADKKFAAATGVTAPSASSPLEPRRVRQTKLSFCSPAEIVTGCPGSETLAVDAPPEDLQDFDATSHRLQLEINALSRFDRAAIETITRECKKSATLASLFSAGLPESMMSAIDVAERQMSSLELREDLPEKVALLGNLAVMISKRLFSDTAVETDPIDEDENDDDQPPQLVNRRSGIRGIVASLQDASDEQARAANADVGNLGNALQQRRSMLLSLMSRARRSNQQGFLFGEADRDSLFGGELSFQDVMPPFAFGSASGGADPAVAVAAADFFGEISGGSNNPGGRAVDDQSLGADSQDDDVRVPNSFLNTVLRCRTLSRGDLSSKGGGAQFAFIQHLANTGILFNDLSWMKASTDAQVKKSRVVTMHKSATIFRDAVDEQDMSLLHLAVCLGSSSDVLNYLINSGARVTPAEIQKAAKTGQASSLRLLLQHTSYTSSVSDSGYSSEILAVFDDAKARHDNLQSMMRNKAGSFIVSLTQRLIRFGLASHRRPSSPRVELCSRALAEILVGDVLLRSLREAQQFPDAVQHVHDNDRNVLVVPEDGDELKVGGLFSSFTPEVLGATTLATPTHATTFLALVEDYLCRKDLGDVSAGLMLLHTMLTSFPEFRQSSELQRFGMKENVSFHLQLVSKRLGDASRNSVEPGAGRGQSTSTSADPCAIAIRCPKRHTAAIHITKHNSFRCDICGSAVDRGRPMYGCRECDWDACEKCTDKAESGTVKCETIKKIASDCLGFLSEEKTDDPAAWPHAAVVTELEANDNTDVLNDLLRSLLNRDLQAVQQLGEWLNVIGKITMFQFQSLVLPAFVACLAGQGQDETKVGSARRKKRARVVDDQAVPSSESPSDDKILFAKQVVRLLFSGGAKKQPSAASSLQGDDGTVQGVSSVWTSEPIESSYEFTCSDEAQEVLRRCHQLLSLHENVTQVGNLLGESGANHELSSLTKAITVVLLPSAMQAAADQTKPLVVSSQPLVPISEVQALVLRSRTINDPGYVVFAKQLAEDQAVIVERPFESTDDRWRVAIVLGFDEKDGTHLLNYASGVKGSPPSSMVISMSSPLDYEKFTFGDDRAAATRMNLAACSFYILSRPGRQDANEGKFLAQNNEPSAKESFKLGVGDSAEATKIHTLTRAWSALSLADAMCPVDLKIKDNLEFAAADDSDIVLHVTTGDEAITQLICEKIAIESPPGISVSFGSNKTIVGLNFAGNKEMTLLSALRQIFEHNETEPLLATTKSCEIFFTISVDDEVSHLLEANKVAVAAAASGASSCQGSSSFGQSMVVSRSRKLSSLSARSLSLDDEDGCIEVCDGVDAMGVQCMKVINLLRVFTQDATESTRNEVYDALFVNETLSKKLKDQLDVALPAASGFLPDWCLSAPSFAPSVFSYECRRTLLERVAFGISRGVLKQQEAKINVTRLRQRMAAFRNRAVELVGEAFSGGADDPTALQLQADELYGMEEALASRVRAAFKAAKWQEHTLQVAKASIRREHLLADANAILQLYATNKEIFHRRLEIRFEGESGFDLASGTEAGVTRGFYADVAEALLSTENVAGVYGSNTCPDSTGVEIFNSVPDGENQKSEQQQPKVPLWIPDLDASGLVVIPTPRADEKGHVGVFPRPLPAYHPLMSDILQSFRFIGRLFAAATRDGFVFPLPLSPAFLKLVLYGKADPALTLPTTSAAVLTSQDLPRPGFLGGEVYAAEAFVCRALDSLDTAHPPLSRFEQDKRYKEIASDVGFARVALGKTYDCSFEDYFQDRTFVDPLDPAQDDSATPLCPRGHEKRVTIYNVREWVALAKKFMLRDGIALQAEAFRDGIEDFFSIDYLRVFTPEELHRDICGGGDGVDKWNESSIRKLFKLDGGKEAAEALVAVAAIGGEGGNSMSRRFGPTSPTIAFLIKALLEGTPKQRRQFLSFVTSVPIETPGRIEVVPLVSPSGEFLPMSDPSCLPRANTCARRLYLPKFSSYDTGSESFKEVFWAVVREESRFKGFYEWRG